MTNSLSIGALESFLIAIAVLFLGHFINSKIDLFKKYNIPEPIVGGLIVAFAITALHFQGISLEFSLPLQNTFMLMFFLVPLVLQQITLNCLKVALKFSYF